MSFPRKYPPDRTTWYAVLDAVERASNWRSDGSVQIGTGARSMMASIPERSTAWEEFHARITFVQGDGSYSWVSTEQRPLGAFADTASFDAPVVGYAASDPASSFGSAGFRPAWEFNGNKSVPINTIVLVRAHYLTGAAAPEMEYEFTFCCGGDAQPPPPGDDCDCDEGPGGGAAPPPVQGLTKTIRVITNVQCIYGQIVLTTVSLGLENGAITTDEGGPSDPAGD